MKASFVLPIFLLGIGGCASIAMAQPPGTFSASGNMSMPRGWGTTATLISNGKVLIAGGTGPGDDPLASAELYEPATGVFTSTGSMVMARAQHTATLLPDGRVLIAGGRGPIIAGRGAQDLASAELYDPNTGAFTPTGTMIALRGPHAATLLADGRVLMTGCAIPCNSAIAELYDPVTGLFVEAGIPGAGGDTATLLADGRVLITGGCPADFRGTKAQLFDSGGGMFSFTGLMPTGCANINSATMLMNGNVLVVGGDEYPDAAEAALYAPSLGTFASVGHTIAPHEFSTSTLLSDGTVLIAGGQLAGGSAIAGVEVYDPATEKFSGTGNMVTTRFGQTATLLPDGRVLIAAGLTGLHPYASPSDVYQPTVTAETELYTPPVLLPPAALISLSRDGRGQGAIQHATSYQTVSQSSPAVAGEILVVYCTGLADGSVVPPQVSIGGRLAEVLWFGKSPGFVGLNQVNVRVPAGISGSAVPVRLNYLLRPSNEVSITIQ